MKNKNRNSWVILFFAVLFSLQSCSYRPAILKFTPKSSDFYWNKGTQVAWANHDSIEVQMSVISNSPNIQVNLSVINHDRKPINIFPNKFYFVATIVDSSQGYTEFHKKYALNPENSINFINRQMNETRTNYQNSTTANEFLLFLGLALDIGSAITNANSSDHHKDEHQTIYITPGIIESQVQNTVNTNEVLNELNSKKEYYVSSVFRNHTLFPNEEISGLIEYEAFNEPAPINFVFIIDSIRFEFPYDAILVTH